MWVQGRSQERSKESRFTFYTWCGPMMSGVCVVSLKFSYRDNPGLVMLLEKSRFLGDEMGRQRMFRNKKR